MISFPLAVAALAASVSACSPPLAHQPHPFVAGALSDVAYQGQLTLDAFAPPGPPRPAAVIIHGSQGSKSTHVTQLFDVLDRAGFAWFSVDYGSADDVTAAIRFIRCPGRFNINREVFLFGEDTGAQIALSLAARGGFRGIVTFGAMLGKSLTGPGAGPDAAVTTPVLMFHGAADDESPPAAAEALCKKLSHCEFHPVAGAIHNFENWHPDQWEWREDLAAWLRRDRRGLWKNISYSHPDGRDLLMDAFVPDGPDPFPAVIIVHGGGWEAGDKTTYVSPVFGPLGRAGFAWFSIDYRLTPFVRVPEELEDVRAAVRYVRVHATRFHVDPQRIALLGESAGGHLVTQIVSEPCAGCEVQAVVSFYGVYDFTKWPQAGDWEKAATTRLFGDWTPDLLRHYSPLLNVRPDLPPLLLIQGTKDELLAGTTEYARRLKAAGSPYELVLLEGAPHGMENWEGHAEWAFYKVQLVEWLAAALKKVEPEVKSQEN